MWERLKQALSNFFMTEVVVEEEPELKTRNASEQKVQKQYQTNQQPQAKMAYTYPKERAFRFPMIPDESSGGTKPQASDVRPVRRNEQPQPPRQRRENQQPVKPKSSEGTTASYRPREPQRPRPEPKEDKKPFQPSEVPSPVYGFRKRKEEAADIVTLGSIQERADWKKIAATSSESTAVKGHSGDRTEDAVMKAAIQQQEADSAAAQESETSHSEPAGEMAAAARAGHTEPAEMLDRAEQLEEAVDAIEETVPGHEDKHHPLADGQDKMTTASSESEALPGMPSAEESHDVLQETASEHESDEEEQVQITAAASPESEAAAAEAPSLDIEREDGPEQSNVQNDGPVAEQAVIEGQSAGYAAEEANENPVDAPIRESADGVRKPVPFNVFMTPRDKRKNLEKIKQPAPKIMEETAEQVNEEQAEPSFTSPPMHLLNDPVEQTIENDAWVDQQIHLLETTLEHFNVNAHVVNAMQGPSVTRFEVQPDMGVKVSKIKSLTDDIKLNMAAKDIRMEAPIPGKNAIGIEVPNAVSKQVGLQEILETKDFQENSSPLSVALGLNISGKPIVTDLQKMPHGLIAGATGSGKSVCINTILLSLLYKANHKQVKFLLIDPKMVELAPYNDLPHLVSPVITDTKAATAALKWAVNEMEERYMKFVGEGVRDIGRYNEKLTKQGRYADRLPYLVIVIDELADLMMVSPQDVEDAICRIAQKARAAGIHLLLATQRPSVDVITGLIKANIPTRIAFSVSSAVDSRTIIDNNGAEKLLGKGDMLFVENGARQAQRIQGAFVSDEEIERVVEHVKQTAPPEYLFQHEDLLERRESEEEEDELYREAVEFVIEHNSASASLLQRRFKIGYNRAARLIDHMEMRGVISEQKGSKPRDVLVSLAQLQAE